MVGMAGRIGLWLMAAGVPAVGLAVGWRWANAHPVLASALIVGYLTLLAALRFTGEVAGELRTRWRDRAVDRVDRLTLRWLSRFARRYRTAMRGAMRFVDLKGLSVVGFYTPELDEVFVDVSLERRAPGRVSGGLVPSETTEPVNRLWLGDLLNRRQPVILAVIGAPGSGKTTLLRHITRRLCRSRRGHRSLPVLLYLRDHAAAIVADPKLALPDLAREQASQYGVSEPPGWFERYLRKGRCVVQLDGFDEVATQDDRRTVASWVERQIVRYPRNDFVVTSRPHGYRDAPIAGAIVLKTCNFTDEQVAVFVRAWYLAVERQASNGDTRSRARSRSADLLDRLRRSPELYKLTVNPLLLTMIANVHRECGALPGSRVDLYGEICQVVLGHRRTAINLPGPLDADAKRIVLGGLAFAMMRKRTSGLSAPDVLAEFQPPLRQLSYDLTAEWLLADVVANGILIEREPDTYAFAHMTLQEYLAATHIRAKQAGDILAGTVNDTWWRETTLLYATRSPVGSIVRACLDDGGTTALMLAFDCAEQDARLEPELQHRLDNVLDAAVAADTDPQRRQVLAGVLVSRDLRQRIRVGDTAEVCRQPISNRIYALFGQVPVNGEPTQPALGMWGSDALMFVSWVNQVINDSPTYRLPRREEIEQPAVREALAVHGVDCVWVDADEGLEQWTRVGTRMPHRIDGSDVNRLVRSDFFDSPQTVARLLNPLSDSLGGNTMRFADAFMHETGMLKPGVPMGAHGTPVRTGPKTELYDVSPDSLAERIRKSCAAITKLRKPSAGSWLHHTIDGLRQVGHEALSTSQQLTDTDATTARLLALCLAGELDDGKLRRAFHEIAAGVTVRQLRERSEVATREAIVLAVG
jgi:hypothetical protein